jgi:hypothetical protein
VGSRSGGRARAQVSDAAQERGGRRPPTLLVAAVVQAVEAAGVFLASVLAGIDAGTGRAYHVDSGIAITVIGLGTAAALAWVAMGVNRARYWSRTPALLTQLFTGIVAIYLVQSQRYSWGVPGLLLAAAGFATLLIPPSMRALADDAQPRSRPRG